MTAASLVIAPAIIVFLAAVGGLWKFASFRGDVFEKWSSRTDLARAGLTEKAVEELRLLHRKIENLLGSGRQFDPAKAVAEPAELLSSVLHFKELLQAREGSEKWLNLLLRLDKILISALIALLGGDVLTALCLLKVLSSWKWVTVAVFLDVASLSTLVWCWIAYFISMRRLSQAEILSTMDRGDL